MSCQAGSCPGGSGDINFGIPGMYKVIETMAKKGDHLWRENIKL